MILPKIIGYLKMNTAKRINQLRDNSGTPVWQRNYYERVIRNERKVDILWQYIAANPSEWEKDENLPFHHVGALLAAPFMSYHPGQNQGAASGAPTN